MARFRSVRVPVDAYDRLSRLVPTIAQNGWRAAGVERSSSVTIGAVLDVALTLLEQKIKVAKK
ncbi:MAG: hypothetical protein JO277_00640 [Candidatus Eremiobacteraeota bacterium]|nr:hypothetical protein [Candidatus Eremiobacteraeota bacterium]